MRPITKALSILTLLAVGALSASAQAVLANTTLSVALNVGNTTVQLASCPTFPTTQINGQAVAGAPVVPYVFLINGEAMRYVFTLTGSAGNACTISVLRGTDGTQNSSHVINSVVWSGSPDRFDYHDAYGACTGGSVPIALPLINLSNGNVFGCSALGNYTLVATANGPVNVGTNLKNVADAAYTALNTDQTIAYTSITAARLVTVPVNPLPMQRLIVKDQSGSATGTFTVKFTGTVDGSTTFSCVAAAYGVCRIYYPGTGTAWFSW